MRIASLIASSTEIVSALGYEKNLVARSHECDFPPSVKSVPQITYPKFPTDGTSYEIDQRVKAIVQEGLSVYRVDAEKLKLAKPDLILTQTQCEVCAVSLKDVHEALHCLDLKAEIISLEPHGLDGIWKDIFKVAVALKDEVAGKNLIASLKERISEIETAALRAPKYRVACIEWVNPLMSAGHWMPELFSYLKAELLFGKKGELSPWMKPAELLKADPDFIVVSPCGLGIEKTKKEMASLKALPEWSKLSAVKQGKVYLADGNQFFNRPGPRIVETLEILAEILHPDVFRFGHEGKGWEKLSY